MTDGISEVIGLESSGRRDPALWAANDIVDQTITAFLIRSQQSIPKVFIISTLQARISRKPEYCCLRIGALHLPTEE